MPTITYTGQYNGIWTGLVRSPDILQQGESLLHGLSIGWDGPSDGLILSLITKFEGNTFANGAIQPNTLISSNTFITMIRVNLSKPGFFSWFLPAPNIQIVATDGAGMPISGSNGQDIHSPNGFRSFSIQVI
jgi:hypothetical protein